MLAIMYAVIGKSCTMVSHHSDGGMEQRRILAGLGSKTNRKRKHREVLGRPVVNDLVSFKESIAGLRGAFHLLF